MRKDGREVLKMLGTLSSDVGEAIAKAGEQFEAQLPAAKVALAAYVEDEKGTSGKASVARAQREAEDARKDAEIRELKLEAKKREAYAGPGLTTHRAHKIGLLALLLRTA